MSSLAREISEITGMTPISEEDGTEYFFATNYDHHKDYERITEAMSNNVFRAIIVEPALMPDGITVLPRMFSLYVAEDDYDTWDSGPY